MLRGTIKVQKKNRRDYREEILEKLGIPKKIFTPLSLPGTVVGNLSEEIKEKILYDEFTTPCSIVRSEEWLVDYLDGEELFALYRKMHSRHPLIAELDIVPQLLRHVIDSADGYSLSHYGRK